MVKRKIRIVSFGSCYVDINLYNFPLKGEGLKIGTETVGDNYALELGGSALIFAQVVSNINLEAVFIGKVGKDPMGALLKNLIERAKITSALVESEEVQTNISPQFIREEEEIITVAGSANQSLTSKELIAQIDKIGEDADYLYLGGVFKMKSLRESYLKIVKIARALGLRIVLDHGKVTNITTPGMIRVVKNLVVLGLVDIYLPNEEELLEVWGFDRVETGLRELKKDSPTTQIVVKQDVKGAMGIKQDKIVHVPAYKVRPINTVGAGDSFNAGFIRAVAVERFCLDDAIRFANATAALTISQLKPLNLEQVMQLYS